MQYSKLSKFLKNKRIQANLTQKQVSDALGYTSPQFVSNWERGISSPPMEALGQLVRILRIRNDEMISIYMNAMETELRTVLKKRATL